MKKAIITILLFLFGMIMGSIITFSNIRIDGVNELDQDMITIECFGHYFDYYYERGI